MGHRETIYVGGKWVKATGREIIAVIDPSTEDCVETVRCSSAEDVDDAVAAAVAAAPEMAALSVPDRVAALNAIADGLERRADELAQMISQEMGMPLALAAIFQVGTAIATFRTTAAVLPEVEFTEQIRHSTVRHEPVGVVAAITPWNYPLLQTACKVAPALAAGCPVVHKPSEIAPLDAFALAEVIDEAGLPPGAYNLVFGNGPDVGERLVRHAGVDMISLTGSTRSGRRVSKLASDGVKRVALELGGKSPSVVLDDADITAAVKHCVASVVRNTGQTCTALTRLLVPFQRLSEVETLVAEEMAGYTVGPASEPGVQIGPLASAAQLQRVEEYLARAVMDGARTVVAPERDGLPERGFFTAPAAFVVSDPSITLAQEEVFGPVLAIIPYVDEEHAVAIANGTPYGLAAAVWSGDVDHGIRVAERIKAGSVAVSGAPFNGAAPFGGYKQSGLGRELGSHGILEFTETKSIQRPVGA